jgi:hypothetical protein
MQKDTEQQILDVLRDMREGQLEALKLMNEQRTLVQEQLKLSQKSVEESIGLQRLSVARQRTVTRVALPGILVCMAAIAYLVLRYF